MLKIRLQRVGRTHEPSFRLVMTDSKNSAKSGRFKEMLGSYDPRKSNDKIDGERVKYWISQGIQLTDSVRNLLITHKVIEGPKVNVSAKSKKKPTGIKDAKIEVPTTVESAVVEPATVEQSATV